MAAGQFEMLDGLDQFAYAKPLFYCAFLQRRRTDEPLEAAGRQRI